MFKPLKWLLWANNKTDFVPAVFVQLACAFRYGSDDLDVMGLCFRKDIWLSQVQLFPDGTKPDLSEMHDTLLKKAGDNSYPFSFQVRGGFQGIGCSVGK